MGVGDGEGDENLGRYLEAVVSGAPEDTPGESGRHCRGSKHGWTAHFYGAVGDMNSSIAAFDFD